MRRLLLVLAALAPGLASAQGPPSPASSPPWTQLSRATSGVDAFQKAQPGRDGRGVVVAVLDTGVDMGVAGLTQLPGGGPKVVDVQDFSGQGDVALERVRREDGAVVWFSDDGAPVRYAAPNVAADAELWFGVVEEARFRGSDVADIDDDGRTDDEFGLLVVRPQGGGDDDALVYVDTDGDRDLAEERPLKNYRLRQDTFSWARVRREQQVTPLTCGLNVLLAERKVVIHYDDGGHGTHVAGIAAGYRLLGQETFHGIAPGAQVISLKIGDNRLSGGATTTGSMEAAFRYAARYAREQGVHVVCNLSYGIDSEIEGLSAIDEFLNDLCHENPGLVVCTSAGNSGPGLSTVGTPAAARHAITVAALLARDTARDVMGAEVPQDVVAVFSSRGAELAKPDIAVPGYATSSVPRWNRWDDFWSGTSMASPYAAGLCAVLLSGHPYRLSDPVRSSWVKGSLMRSARPLAGFGPLDVGAGVPALARAAADLDALVKRGAPGPLYDLEVETECPTGPDGKGEVAYWRTTWLPGGKDPLLFEVTPVFVPGPDADAPTAFSRRYTLSSETGWLRPAQTQFYFRGQQKAEVRIACEPEGLAPGLHVGTVRARRADGPDDVDLRFRVALVVPEPASASHIASVRGQASGWTVRRHFFAVPPGATAMHVALSAPEGQESRARVRELFGPDGHVVWAGELRLDTRKGGRRVDWSLPADEVRPGIWELCVSSDRPDRPSPYELAVAFSGVRAWPRVVTEWSGETPGGKLDVVDLFAPPRTVVGAGSLEGIRTVHELALTPNDDEASVQVELPEGVAAVRLRLEFTREGFARFTDVALTATGPGGALLMQEALGERSLKARFSRPASGGAATLKLVGGFSDAEDDEEVEARLEVDVLWADPVAITVKRGQDARWTLYPGAPCRLRWAAASPPPEVGAGEAVVGRIELLEAGSRRKVLTVPIERYRD